jgi:prophage maintenance system killer protein
MPALRYLTVQDVLWIDALLYGASRQFRALDLEEATSYQFGYGTSTDLTGQAARFLKGFLEKSPFEGDNEATAFVAFCAFLRLNEKLLKLKDADAPQWLENVQLLEPASLEKSLAGVEGSHGEGVEEAVREVMARFPDAIAKLVTGNPVTA